MPNLLYHLSDFMVFLILIAITTTASVIIILLNKRYIKNKLRYKDNTTIGSISSLIGIIYGVLVGFIALYLINNHDHALNSVQMEASAAANIYRDSLWLKQPFQKTIQDDLQLYLDTVINQEWSAMRDFKPINQEGDFIILKISNDLKSMTPNTAAENIILQDLLTGLNALYSARHVRIEISSSELGPELWEVILAGTILIIAINYAFRVNLYLHLFGISTFAIMAASMLFLLITLDRPFQGEFVIEPYALKNVITLMKHQT